MLHIRDFSMRHQRDGRELIHHLTCHFNPGDRVVIIGEEGNGKSTLLQQIAATAGVIPAPDYIETEGSIELDSTLVAYLPQILPDDAREDSIYDFVCRGPGVDPWDTADWASAAVDLGLDPDRLFSTQTMGTLSGGERIKVQLARLRITSPDIWLLDEPSNDLDLETLAWLETWLQRRKELVVYISHDETLIRRSSNVILHLESIWRKTEARHTVAALPYGQYVEERLQSFAKQDQLAKKEEAEFQAKKERYEQIRNKVEHQQDTISRGDPHGGRLLKKKMASVQALGRRMEKAYEDRTRTSDSEDAILAFFDEAITVPSGKEILDLQLDRLSVAGLELAQRVELRIIGPEKVAIIGRNGSGKTTLLRLIAERLLPRKDLRVAYMPQDYSDRMPADRGIIDWLVPDGRVDRVQAAHDHLGAMRFTFEEMQRPVGDLSGGQKAKLFILRMILERNDVLILDEPTRNFSPLSGPVIREILAAYGGVIISVSHDRLFLTEVPDRVLALDRDGLTPVDASSFRSSDAHASWSP